MNKTLLWIIGAIIIVVALIFFFMSGDKAGDEGTPTGENTASSKQSMKDLFASGKSQKCEYSTEAGGNRSAGVVYLASGKMRGDFDAQAAGQTIKSHMIVDGNVSYIWTDGQAAGFKMSTDAAQPSGSGNDTQSQGSVDMSQQLDYRCSGWREDASLFELPSGVEFTDLSAALPQVPGGNVQGEATGSASGSADLKAMQCAACGSLTGDSKAQCLAALSCN